MTTSDGVNAARRRTSNKEEPPMDCSMRTGNNEEHRQGKDTYKKPLECSYCGKSFRFKSHLETHLRVHTGDRPYHCQDCNSSFTVKSNLVAHLRTHTGEKPFQCHLCPTSFSQSGILVRHLRVHKGEKPFQCEFCPKAFRQKHKLKCHKDAIHHEKHSYITTQY